MRKLFSAALVLLVLLATASSRMASSEGTDARAAFFSNVKALCGRTFEGATQFPDDPNHDFAGKRLVATVASCSDTEIRIPFHVGEDTSRTWILTLGENGLLIKHDHRHADGTPDEITMYGGWATSAGTAHRQYFEADDETKKLIPEAATNVWMIEIDLAKQELVYYLERHAEPRYRAVLRLKPVAE